VRFRTDHRFLRPVDDPNARYPPALIDDYYNGTETESCPGFVLAYSLSNAGSLSSNPIWPSTLPSTPDFIPAPYAIPTAVNGNVYAQAYGLCTTFSGGACVTADGYRLSGVQVYGF